MPEWCCNFSGEVLISWDSNDGLFVPERIDLPTEPPQQWLKCIGALCMVCGKDKSRESCHGCSNCFAAMLLTEPARDLQNTLVRRRSPIERGRKTERARTVTLFGSVLVLKYIDDTKSSLNGAPFRPCFPRFERRELRLGSARVAARLCAPDAQTRTWWVCARSTATSSWARRCSVSASCPPW